jgi:alkanesulfonate monooxygenase SsuD/methylene tetrahydromethanopterin reductase-like flavin-dependent oxidoreductase (luciferase family)
LAAKHFDHLNIMAGFDELPRKVQVVKERCEEIGRDPATLRLSTTLPVACGTSRAEAEQRVRRLGEPGERLLAQGVVGEPGDVIEKLERLAVAGCETVYFHIYDIDDLDHLELLGREVLPAVGGGGNGDHEDPRGRAVRARSVVGDH